MLKLIALDELNSLMQLLLRCYTCWKKKYIKKMSNQSTPSKSPVKTNNMYTRSEEQTPSGLGGSGSFKLAKGPQLAMP